MQYLEKKVVEVNFFFWQTWAPPCQKKLQPLQASQVFRDRITSEFNFLQYYTQALLKPNITTKLFTHDDMQKPSLLTYQAYAMECSETMNSYEMAIFRVLFYFYCIWPNCFVQIATC
jgi:hypothetical protein